MKKLITLSLAALALAAPAFAGNGVWTYDKSEKMAVIDMPHRGRNVVLMVGCTPDGTVLAVTSNNMHLKGMPIGALMVDGVTVKKNVLGVRRDANLAMFFDPSLGRALAEGQSRAAIVIDGNIFKFSVRGSTKAIEAVEARCR